MDVHRTFAEIAIVENGLCRDEGWIGVTPETLRVWAETLEPDSEVALEATGSSDATAVLLRPIVRRVVISNPRKTRVIAEGQGQDRQGRRPDPGAVVGGALLAAGVAAR